MRADESKFSAEEQIRRFGRITFVERDTRACGDVALIVANQIDVWRSEEDFVDFWQSMSEHRIAAYFAGLFSTRYGSRNSRQVGKIGCTIHGTPMSQQFADLAKRDNEEE